MNILNPILSTLVMVKVLLYVLIILDVTFTLLGTETENRENGGFLAQGYLRSNGKSSTSTLH